VGQAADCNAPDKPAALQRSQATRDPRSLRAAPSKPAQLQRLLYQWRGDERLQKELLLSRRLRSSSRSSSSSGGGRSTSSSARLCL
jgi:hypothetical protein